MPDASPKQETAITKPLLVYDGKCGFCKRWVTRWRDLVGDAVDFEPFQEAAARFPQIPLENFKKSIQLIEPQEGATTTPTSEVRVTPAARAAFRTLALAGQYRWLSWSFDHVPGFAAVTEVAYRFVAGHREPLAYLDRFFFGKHVVPIRYALTRSMYLRLLGAVYLVAFLSLWVQIDGLIGSRGILPVAQFIEGVRAKYGSSPDLWRQLPTLAWVWNSDTALHAMCAGGVAAATALIIGVAPLPMLVILWGLYLSLLHAGQIFLGYQWDALLLEAGFLAIFFAPPLTLWLGWTRGGEPSRWVLFLQRFLIFKLMLLSGIVKLTSGDRTWVDWTALTYHYWSQPLPTWTAWYVHQLPLWFQKLSTGAMFFAELAVPVLMLLPRRLRIISFWMTVVFQLLIAGTGNYGFFNLLAIVLCVPLLDDSALRFGRNFVINPSPRVRHAWTDWVTMPIGAFIILISLTYFLDAFRDIHPPAPLAQVRRFIRPFEIVNPYGLFRVMTRRRFEIIIEGSNDRETWQAYEFRYKPGDLKRRPQFVPLHMPRLDWQMWFAALGSSRHSPWFYELMDRLHEGSPPVLGLLEHNPFPDAPPRYLRASFFEYHFTTAKERRETHAWWKREYLGVYYPG